MNRASWKQITATGGVLTGSGALIAVVLTAGSDTATVTLDDSTDGSGTSIVTLSATANTSVVFAPCVALPVGTGIYATTTGTGEKVSVVYVP